MNDPKIRQASKPFSFNKYAPQNRVYPTPAFTPDQVVIARAETDEIDMFATEDTAVEPVLDVPTGPCGCLQCK